MIGGSFDRILMIILAIIEFLTLIAMLSVGGSALAYVGDHASSAPVASDAIDQEDRLRRLLNISITCGAFALFSLISVTTYYTTGALLLWLGSRADKVRKDDSSHQKMLLAPTSGAEGYCRITLKLLNITVGLLGIITITVSVTLFGVAQWQADMVIWADVGNAKEIGDLLGATTGLAIMALLMKVAEAFLGHVWAIMLSNTRDYVATRRDQDVKSPFKA